MEKLEKYLELIRLQDERIKSLKKENKKLNESLDAYSNRCILCGSRENLTKHSLVGNHKKPFVTICRKDHDLIEGIKSALKAIKGEENNRLSVSRFKKLVRTFETLK